MGILPRRGSWDDQVERFCQAMDIVREEKVKAERDELEKQKQDLEKDRQRQGLH